MYFQPFVRITPLDGINREADNHVPPKIPDDHHQIRYLDVLEHFVLASLMEAQFPPSPVVWDIDRD
jgi:hypothetical protein